MVSCTSICTSHDVAGFSAPTGVDSDLVRKQSLIGIREISQLGLDDERLLDVAEVLGHDALVKLCGARAEQEIQAAQQGGLADVVRANKHEVTADLQLNVRQPAVIADGNLGQTHQVALPGTSRISMRLIRPLGCSGLIDL
jgi:hypothetical protein